jgi:hypothetical protein
MLEISKTLNTSEHLFYSKKVKDIIMSNQQETNSFSQLNIKRVGSSETTQEGSFIVLSKVKERLRYSPTNFKNNNLSLNNLKSLFMNKLLNVRKNHLSHLSIHHHHFATISRHQDENNDKINPYWITGFVDAEGCFSVIIDRSNITKWKIKTSFEINLHIKDVDILHKIKSFFGVGAIYLRVNKNIAVYRISKMEYLRDIIIPHFKIYSLISTKSIDFYFWCKVIEIIYKKEHLSHSGFLNILIYYASINRGISKQILKFYPQIKPLMRHSVNLPLDLNPHWVSGFVSGDGGFSIIIRPSKSYILKQQVSCRFHIAQHIRDIELINLFNKFFNCGNVYVRTNLSERCDFVVQDIKLLISNIIPHFDSYPILNLKYKDYICFKKALNIIQLKQHLTQEGLDFIKKLNLEMNSNRLK